MRAVRQAVAGHGETWLVGGTVRDALLGRPLADVDIVVAGDPEPAARAVARALDGPVFALSEAFGAWRAIAASRELVCDVSPLHGHTIEADLARRDFTANAMAVPLAGGDLVDPHGGRVDVAERTLRVLGRQAYADDPLRPLRLVRLAAELGFSPEPETERLTREAAPRVTEASPERVFAELRRLMAADGALEGLELADRLGLVAAVLPEVAALHGVEQSHFHHLDVYGHTLEVLAQQIQLEGSLDRHFGELAPRLEAVLAEPLADELSRREALRLAALLHDVGKPATRGVVQGGRVTFVGHDSTGERMVRGLCRRLRASQRLASFLGAVTRHHLTLGFLVHRRPLSRRDVYRYLASTSPVGVEVTLLTCADRLATRGKGAEAAIGAHLELARELMPEALEWRVKGPPPLPVRGDELADGLGIPPGPELGSLLERLREAAFVGEVSNSRDALDLARRLREDADP